MTKTIRRAYATANAATTAAQAASHAICMRELIPDPTWNYIDLAHRLCREAVKECEFALDALESEWTENSDLWEDAHDSLTGAMHKAHSTAAQLYEYAASIGKDLLN